MAIKCTTPKAKIDNWLNQGVKILQRNILQQLQYLGVELVNQVRDRDKYASWFDQTGNLRSSIGAAVYGDGKKVMQTAFNVVTGVDGQTGDKGKTEGEKYINELARGYSQAFALVVVAGMDYASFVEAMQGKDVLASAEQTAKQVIGKRIQEAIDDTIIALNRMS